MVEQSYAQRLTAIAEIGRAVTSILDLTDQLRTLVELLEKSLGYYGAAVWIMTEPAESVQVKAGHSNLGEDLGPLEIQVAMATENPITWVCQTGVHFLREVVEDPHGVPLGEYFPETRSLLVLPLKIAQKHVGALEILSQRSGVFKEDEIALLRSLADQATIAIRNATLYSAEQSRRRFAETLYKVGRALSSTIHLDEILQIILNLTDEIVPSDRSAVMLRDGGDLEFVATRGFPEDMDTSGMRLALQADPIFSKVFESQQPLSIPDAQLYAEFQQIGDLPRTRSWMGVPLLVADQVIGMLSLARHRLNPYSFSEVTLAQTFASQAAIALENARLYDRLERFSQQLEERVQERTEELQAAYAELERVDETKTNFIQVTSHELRTPLTVLLGYSQMLMKNQMIAADPMLRQLVDGIFSGADRLHDIVNSMLDMVKIDNALLEIAPEPVVIGLLVRNVAGNFKNALRHREINLVIDDLSELPQIQADMAALEKVFVHLLSNAIKYTPNHGSVHISGRLLPANKGIPGDWIEVILADTGIGIDLDQQELIFTKFYQTGQVALHSTSRTQYKGGGPGLGLAIVRGIVEAHGGRVWAESAGHDEVNFSGSQFHVVLPVQPLDKPAPGQVMVVDFPAK
jgi:signal transduction histidine kinase